MWVEILPEADSGFIVCKWIILASLLPLVLLAYTTAVKFLSSSTSGRWKWPAASETLWRTVPSSSSISRWTIWGRPPSQAVEVQLNHYVAVSNFTTEWINQNFEIWSLLKNFKQSSYRYSDSRERFKRVILLFHPYYFRKIARFSKTIQIASYTEIVSTAKTLSLYSLRFKHFVVQNSQGE